jgi:hypothetical protein
MIPTFPARTWSGEDERCDEADESERLGQGEADPHELLDAAAGLRLTRHGLDRVTEDQADADARADSGKAVSQGTKVLDGQGARGTSGDNGCCGERHAISFAVGPAVG